MLARLVCCLIEEKRIETTLSRARATRSLAEKMVTLARRGGLAVKNQEGFTRFIHDITNAQFRSKFETDINRMHGNKGIGVIDTLKAAARQILMELQRA